LTRITRLLEDTQSHAARSGRAELILSAWLVLLVTSVYLAVT